MLFLIQACMSWLPATLYTAGLWTAGCQLTPPDPSPVLNFSATLPHICSMGLLWPKHRVWHLVLLMLIQLAPVLCPSCPYLSVGPSSGRLILPPNLMFSPNIQNLHSTFGPPVQITIKILNRICPSISPWKTPLMTSRQLDLTPIPWAWYLSSKEYACLRQAASFSGRMLWEYFKCIYFVYSPP